MTYISEEIIKEIFVMGWVKQIEDGNLPKWLTDNLKHQCDCGSEILNFYNPRGDITARKCSNPNCPYMLAERIVGMCELLGIKGIGSKTAYNLIKSHDLTSQFQALPYVLSSKPSVSLYTYMRMCFIEGIDTAWENVTKGYTEVHELFTKYNGQYKNILEDNKDIILSGVDYVTFSQGWRPEYKAKFTATVMISGNIRGFDKRNDFISAINVTSKGIVRLSVAEHKRATGIYALIQEADTPNRGKAECAIENGIPIVTPEEFQKDIAAIIGKYAGQFEREVY